MHLSPFERLSAPAVLWYFLALLLLAATVMNARIELEMLAVLALLLVACGGWHALSALPGGLLAGLFVGVLTLLLHYQGDRVLLHLGPIVVTSEGLHWALCLGIGMAIIILSATLQTIALRRLRLEPGLPRVAQRLALICALAIALIPAIASRMRLLFDLIQADSHTRRHWLPRLRILTYAILAETLEDASNRTSTLALLGPRFPVQKPGAPAQKPGAAQENHPANLPQNIDTLLENTATPASATNIAVPNRNRARTVRSALLMVLATLLFALILLPQNRPPAVAGIPDIAAILLTALPLLVEGGGRLWSRLHA